MPRSSLASLLLTALCVLFCGCDSSPAPHGGSALAPEPLASRGTDTLEEPAASDVAIANAAGKTPVKTPPKKEAAGNIEPATATEAAKVLDLRKFPLPPGTIEPVQRGLATLNCTATGTVSGVFGFIKGTLEKQKWAEVPGGYVTEQTAMATFAKDGYKVSLSVFPGSQHEGKDTAQVTLSNHGNIDFGSLPVPEKTTSLYSGPVNAMFKSELSVEEGVRAINELFTKAGWVPYGDAGSTYFFKKNAVRVGARIDTAPAQDNATMIDYSSVLLSSDIPLPKDAVQVQYVDVPTQLSFDLPVEQSVVSKFYVEELAKAGWKATTENPVQIDFRNFQIFRNPAKDLLEVQLHTVEEKTRVLVKLQSAEDVAREDKRVAEEIAKKKALANQPAKKISVELPADAESVKTTVKQVEFTLPIGKAQAASEVISKKFTDDGWEATGKMFEKMFGTVTLSKGDQSISLTYVESGVLPAEVTLNITGAELDAAKK